MLDQGQGYCQLYKKSKYYRIVSVTITTNPKAVGQGLPFKRSECSGDGGEDGGSDWEEIDGSSVAQTCAMCNQTVIADNTKYVQQVVSLTLIVYLTLL